MTGIDARQAAAALGDIEEIVQRVRQSRTYDIASLMMILWGVLVFAGNIATFAWPRYGGYIWIGVNAAGAAGSIAVSVFQLPGTAGAQLRPPDGDRLSVLLCLRLAVQHGVRPFRRRARWAPSGRSISC